MMRIIRMWEFWLNYAVILLVILPLPVLQMRYIVTINGEEFPQEPQSRTMWQCYKFLWVEGMGNPWNAAAVAMHWILPFLLVLTVWSLILRGTDGTKEQGHPHD